MNRNILYPILAIYFYLNFVPDGFILEAIKYTQLLMIVECHLKEFPRGLYLKL